MRDQEYFAIGADIRDLNQKVEDYYNTLWDLGHTQKMQRAHFYYYGKGGQASFLQAAGSQGQLTDIMVNDFRSISQHTVSLVTANRASFDVVSTNTDYKSIAQAVLAEQILEYYMKENKLEKLLKRQCDFAVKYSEGFLGLDWDTSLGQPVGQTPEGKPLMDGDIRYSLYHPLQVVRDVFNDGNQDWVITVQKLSKYELAAKYPAAAEDILRLDNSQARAHQRDLDYLLRGGVSGETDMIPFYTFYHRKSAALPEGRICFFVETKKLLDGPLPYDTIPLTRMVPKDLDGTCLGYTAMWDLLGIQEASDKLYSAVTSNNLAFSKQVVQTTADNDINVSDLADGIMLIESDAELKPLQLTRSAPETYQLLQAYQSKMQELSGINEVVRGVPGPNLRSGNALAIVAAQAITYNSDITASYSMAVEDAGTITIRFLKSFAKHPRFASIVGKYKRAYLKQFTADSLTNIDRVTVQQRNAVMSTTAGKLQLAENLLQNGVIQKPEEYMMVVETGNLDMLTDPSVVEGMLIRQENESISEGKVPQAVLTDKHARHISEHAAVLANIEARANPEVVSAYVAHVQEHIDLLRTTDPVVLQITGNQPIPPAQPPAPQAGSAEIQQPPESGAMPAGQPSMPTLPEGTDAMTQESYQQLGAMSGV